MRALRQHGPTTLRGRLGLLALATSAICVIGFTAAFNLILDHQLHQQIDQQLRTRAAAIAATVATGTDGRVVVREVPNDEALDGGAWIYQGGTEIERPRVSVRVQDAVDRLVNHGEVFDTAVGSRFYALPLRVGGRQVGTVVTQASLDAYAYSSRVALVASGLLDLLLLGCGYVVARMIVGRALRPVTAMSADAAQWSAQATSKRFATTSRPAELAELGANLDVLLDRMAAVLRHEQQLTAELSHELRTPLARISAEVEWLTGRRRGAAEQDASHQAIADAAARMREICRTLLDQARSGTESAGRCEVADVLARLARCSEDEHPGAPPVVVAAGEATAGVPAPRLERMLTPLLDNARRYARTRIRLTCHAHPGEVEIGVADDGPGVPREVADRIFQAGRRADPDDGHDGVGLGLPLARRLARAAGGDVTLASTTSGAHFVVRLPGR